MEQKQIDHLKKTFEKLLEEELTSRETKNKLNLIRIVLCNGYFDKGYKKAYDDLKIEFNNYVDNKKYANLNWKKQPRDDKGRFKKAG